MSLFLVVLAGIIVLALVIGFIAWLLAPESVVVVEDNGIGYSPNPYLSRPYGSTVIVEDDDDYVVPAILAAEAMNVGYGYNDTVVVQEPGYAVGSPDLDVPAVPQSDTSYTSAPNLDVPAVPAYDTPSYSPDLDVPSVPDSDTGSSWSDNSGGSWDSGSDNSGGGSDW